MKIGIFKIDYYIETYFSNRVHPWIRILHACSSLYQKPYKYNLSLNKKRTLMLHRLKQKKPSRRKSKKKHKKFVFYPLLQIVPLIELFTV